MNRPRAADDFPRSVRAWRSCGASALRSWPVTILGRCLYPEIIPRPASRQLRASRGSHAVRRRL
jgi:hypothetical protein